MRLVSPYSVFISRVNFGPTVLRATVTLLISLTHKRRDTSTEGLKHTTSGPEVLAESRRLSIRFIRNFVFSSVSRRQLKVSSYELDISPLFHKLLWHSPLFSLFSNRYDATRPPLNWGKLGPGSSMDLHRSIQAVAHDLQLLADQLSKDIGTLRRNVDIRPSVGGEAKTGSLCCSPSAAHHWPFGPLGGSRAWFLYSIMFCSYSEPLPSLCRKLDPEDCSRWERGLELGEQDTGCRRRGG
jgi:hypothetical protein